MSFAKYFRFLIANCFSKRELLHDVTIIWWSADLLKLIDTNICGKINVSIFKSLKFEVSKNFNKILTSITWGLSSVISIKLPMDMVLSSNLALLVYNCSRSMNLYVLLVVKHYVNSDFISCLHFPSLSNYSSFLVVASRGCCFQLLISKHVMFFDLVCQSSLH